MVAKRNYHRYKFVQKGKIKHKGITKDLERREAEHRVKFGGGKIKKIGPAVSEETAREWEKEQGVS